MKFNEIKKNKDPRVVKPRDPNFKVMQDIKKSGAAGSHGDKTKVIPRKQKHREERTDEVIPLLWAGAMYGHRAYQIYRLAQALRMTNAARGIMAVDKAAKTGKALRTGEKILGLGSKLKIPANLSKPAQNAGSLGKDAKNLLGKGAKNLGKGAKNVGKAAARNPGKTATIGGIAYLIDQFPEIPQEFWDFLKKYGIPAAAALAIIYGGKKLYDYFQELGDDAKKDDDDYKNPKEPQPQEDIEEADANAPARLLGKAEAHLGYGLEMAQYVLNKDLDKAESMARVIVDGWPETIKQIHNVYKQNGESIKEDLDSPAHKAQSSIWHKSNPIGNNFMNPDDYDSDAPGTHIIMDNPTELHFYKVPAKNYDEAFDKWLDGKSYGDRVQDHEFYDSTKDYASEHQYWGRIAPDEPEPEDDDWSDEDEKEFGTAKQPDEQESLTNEEIAKILEGDFAVKNLDDYRAKIKALYGLERYMKSDPELAAEVKRRYRQLAKWKIDYDKANTENYEQQIYDGIKETATAGATSAGNVATVVNPKQAYGHRPKDKKGLPKAPQKKKADGTAVNALDIGNNLMGGATVKR